MGQVDGGGRKYHLRHIGRKKLPQRGRTLEAGILNPPISLGTAFDPKKDYKYLPFMVLIAFVMLWLGWQSRHSCLWKPYNHVHPYSSFNGKDCRGTRNPHLYRPGSGYLYHFSFIKVVYCFTQITYITLNFVLYTAIVQNIFYPRYNYNTTQSYGLRKHTPHLHLSCQPKSLPYECPKAC